MPAIPRPIPAILISFAAAIAATLPAAPGAWADASVPAHGKQPGFVSPEDLAAPPATALSIPVEASAPNCVQLPATSAARAAGATAACVQIDSPSGSGGPAKSNHAGTAQADAAGCQAAPESYFVHRHDYCLNDLEITYEEVNLEEPEEILGTAVLTVNSNATLSAASGQWQESETVTLSSVTGMVEDLNVGFTASCTASCTATVPNPWPGNRLLVKGQTASGTVTFQATPGPGQVNIHGHSMK